MTQETTANNTGQLVRDRIPVLTKMAYGLGTALDMWGLWLYPGVAFAVFNIYLGVSPWLVGLALTLIRLYDAISDPFVGWISDNVRTKYGRRRPFILVSGIIMRPGTSDTVFGFAFLVGQDVPRSIGCLLVYDCIIDDLHSHLQHLHRAL